MQRNFRQIFDEVAKENTPYILTRGSRPEAVLIPYDAFVKFIALQEQEILERYDRLAERVATYNTNASDKEIEADIRDAIREIRESK
jgi:prevent-host-death family protein